jgi:hypothetical protein
MLMADPESVRLTELYRITGRAKGSGRVYMADGWTRGRIRHLRTTPAHHERQAGR